MNSFSLPAFARLSPKILRAEKELQQLENYYSQQSDQLAAGDWGAMSAISLGVHNVYNGMEDILLGIARDIDGAVPSGATMHQDILDQELYEALAELKSFRHLVRHRYGFDLKSEKVIENFHSLQAVFPQFLNAVIRLERTLAAEA